MKDACIGVLLCAALAGGAVAPSLALGQRALAGNTTEARTLPNFARLVREQGPAVVNISTTRTTRMGESDGEDGESIPDDIFAELLRRFFSQQLPQEFQARTLGSGFILTDDGYVLTNAHVVADTDEILVRLTDKRQFKARIVGLDVRTDIALIKIDARNLPVVRMGDPNKLEVGEWVAAIGAPFGFENSVTAGIVSAKGRMFPEESYIPFIQTDVAVNPGNSGGPLFNLNGEVVGINSMIYSRTGGFMGLSFAIPIDLANDVAQQLRTKGRVVRGRLGVTAQGLTPELAESFGLKQAVGAVVTMVERDGPADRAGIRTGDVMVRVDDQPINEPADLGRIIAGSNPNTRITIALWRRGAMQEVTLTVGEQDGMAAPHARRPEPRPDRLGLSVVDLTAAQRQLFGVEHGVLVRNAIGIAQRAGVRSADIIIAVNDGPVTDLASFNRLIEKSSGRSIALLIRRGASTLYVPLNVP